MELGVAWKSWGLGAGRLRNGINFSLSKDLEILQVVRAI